MAPATISALAAIERVLVLCIGVAVLSWSARRFGHTAPTPHKNDDEVGLAEVLAAVRANVSGATLRAMLEGVPSEAQRKALANGVHVAGSARKTALWLACENRSPALASVLLDFGANVSAGRLDEGTTPLHIAGEPTAPFSISACMLARHSRTQHPRVAPHGVVSHVSSSHSGLAALRWRGRCAA